MKPALCVALLSVVVCGSGCGGRAVTHESLIATGHDPSYADGFMHGYSSGRAMGGGMGDRWCRLPDRYTSDTYYQQGWDEGYVFGTREIARANQAVADWVQRSRENSNLSREARAAQLAQRMGSRGTPRKRRSKPAESRGCKSRTRKE